MIKTKNTRVQNRLRFLQDVKTGIEEGGGDIRLHSLYEKHSLLNDRGFRKLFKDQNFIENMGSAAYPKYVIVNDFTPSVTLAQQLSEEADRLNERLKTRNKGVKSVSQAKEQQKPKEENKKESVIEIEEATPKVKEVTVKKKVTLPHDGDKVVVSRTAYYFAVGFIIIVVSVGIFLLGYHLGR